MLSQFLAQILAFEQPKRRSRKVESGSLEARRYILAQFLVTRLRGICAIVQRNRLGSFAMSSSRKRFLIWTLSIAACFLALDFKNWYFNGAPFVVSEGLLDRVKIYANFPGFIVAIAIFMALKRELLDMSYWMAEIPGVALSSILYGWIFSKTLELLKNRKILNK